MKDTTSFQYTITDLKCSQSTMGNRHLKILTTYLKFYFNKCTSKVLLRRELISTQWAFTYKT